MLFFNVFNKIDVRVPSAYFTEVNASFIVTERKACSSFTTVLLYIRLRVIQDPCRNAITLNQTTIAKEQEKHSVTPPGLKEIKNLWKLFLKYCLITALYLWQ